MLYQVKVIVMITRLVEGSGSSKRKKADCYWPDSKVMMMMTTTMMVMMWMRTMMMMIVGGRRFRAWS